MLCMELLMNMPPLQALAGEQVLTEQAGCEGRASDGAHPELFADTKQSGAEQAGESV